MSYNNTNYYNGMSYNGTSYNDTSYNDTNYYNGMSYNNNYHPIILFMFIFVNPTKIDGIPVSTEGWKH